MGYNSYANTGYEFIQCSDHAASLWSSRFWISFNRYSHTNAKLFLLSWQTTKTEGKGDDEQEVLDEETTKKDQIVKGAIDGLIREYAAELNAPSQDEDSQRRKRKKEKKEEVY